MIPDIPHNITETANRVETLQSQDTTKKFFDGANLIFILRGNSGIIKFEFKTI